MTKRELRNQLQYKYGISETAMQAAVLGFKTTISLYPDDAPASDHALHVLALFDMFNLRQRRQFIEKLQAKADAIAASNYAKLAEWRGKKSRKKILT